MSGVLSVNVVYRCVSGVLSVNVVYRCVSGVLRLVHNRMVAKLSYHLSYVMEAVLNLDLYSTVNGHSRCSWSTHYGGFRREVIRPWLCNITN